MTFDDARAARLYAEADALARRYEVDPGGVGSRRMAGTRHVNWKVGPADDPCLVRVPMANQPPLLKPPEHREVDVLRMFSGSGVTAELLHDRGDRHIQEYVTGQSVTIRGPGWLEWIRRAPAEIPHVLATFARHGPERAAPAAGGWVARQEAAHASWLAAWQSRESLYTALGVPRKEFFALFGRALTGDRPQVGVHGDTKLANCVMAPSGIKLVDVELFGYGDGSMDLAKHLLGTRYDDALSKTITENTYPAFRSEVSREAAEGLREDVPFLVRYFGAEQVMGTLHQRVSGLERLAAGPQGRAAAENALDAVSKDIRQWTNYILDQFGRPQWEQQAMVSALGQWVLHDHPAAQREHSAAPHPTRGPAQAPGARASPANPQPRSREVNPSTIPNAASGVRPWPTAVSTARKAEFAASDRSRAAEAGLSPVRANPGSPAPARADGPRAAGGISPFMSGQAKGHGHGLAKKLKK